MIKYAIPGMYELREANLNFLKFKQDHPECFYEDIEIDAIYGNPQFCIWDGGRIFSNYEHANTDLLIDLYNIYNNIFNIPIRYVFTNTILEEKHYLDRFGNILMELAHNGKNQVVVNNDNFLKYLHNTYPKYSYISSTTKCLSNKEEAKQELNKAEYDLICLDYNLNKNLNFLKTLTEEEKEKTEFLINPICAPKCAHRKEHYYLNSVKHLNYGKNYTMEHCFILADPFYPDNKAHGNNISYQEIKEIYEPLGFSHFKIEGRTWSPAVLYVTYCDYMIKPEYKNYSLTCLLAGLKEER